jgi:hypothetical protein
MNQDLKGVRGGGVDDVAKVQRASLAALDSIFVEGFRQ